VRARGARGDSNCQSAKACLPVQLGAASAPLQSSHSRRQQQIQIFTKGELLKRFAESNPSGFESLSVRAPAACLGRGSAERRAMPHPHTKRERALEIPRQILAVIFELFGAPDLHFYQCEPAVQNQQ